MNSSVSFLAIGVLIGIFIILWMLIIQFNLNLNKIDHMQEIAIQEATIKQDSEMMMAEAEIKRDQLFNKAILEIS